MNCKYCNSMHIQKDGNYKGYQRYKCMECNKRFNGEKYEDYYITHFKTKIKKTDRNILTRENYCTPTKELEYKEKHNIKVAMEFIKINKKPPLFCPKIYYEIPNRFFEDTEHYTDEFVEWHYKNCMKNFDLNMEFFSKLKSDEFNQCLNEYVDEYKFIQIDDLEEVNGCNGAYILVLDKYKQVYIGVSISAKGIKNRILQHWSKKKEFGSLLNGDVETSILSIDSFGALDTTRIFYKTLDFPDDVLFDYERKLVSDFNADYRLNRVAGGINNADSPTIRNMKLLSSIQERKLKKIVFKM